MPRRGALAPGQGAAAARWALPRSYRHRHHRPERLLGHAMAR